MVQRVIAMVQRVIDGDTFKTTTEDQEDVTIRLANVGAPEIGQPGADQAAEELQCLLGSEAVTLKRRSIDRYGRWVCDVKNADGIDVNQAMRDFLDGYSGN